MNNKGNVNGGIVCGFLILIAIGLIMMAVNSEENRTYDDYYASSSYSSGSYNSSSSSTSHVGNYSHSASSSSSSTGRYCGKDGCTRMGGTGNGTVFCDFHAAQYAREQGYSTCSVSGCYGHKQSGGSYCSGHTCRNSNCTAKAGDDHYCSSHSSKNKTSSSTSSYSSKTKNYKIDSYDEGYESIYMDDDYDLDRYNSDDEYSTGVDDALDEMDEYGEDW